MEDWGQGEGSTKEFEGTFAEEIQILLLLLVYLGRLSEF